MAYQINGIDIPASFRDKGRLLPPRPTVVRTNGQGESVEARHMIATWTFRSLTKADYEWWSQTILAGKTAKRCAAVLPNDTWVETTYPIVLVRNLKSDGLSFGYYPNVSVEIVILAV